MKYASKKQKRLLTLIGIPITKGLKKEMADALLQQAVASRRVSQVEIDQPWRLKVPTEKQIEFLTTNQPGANKPELTRGQAADLITAFIKVSDQRSPMRERQSEFIDDLWGEIYAGMNADQASNYIDFLLDNLPKTLCCQREYQRHNEECPQCGRRIGSVFVQPRKCPETIYRRKSFWFRLFRGLKGDSAPVVRPLEFGPKK